MAVARNIEDSDRMMRTAAIERLRKDHGVVVGRFKRNSQALADEITKVAGRFPTTDPMSIIRSWLGVKPPRAAMPAKFIGTGREYRPDATMRAAIERLGNFARPVSMASKVPYNSFEND